MRVSRQTVFYEISDESILMINSLTGAVDIINPQIYRALLDFESSGHIPLDEFTLKSLLKRGYLVENDEAENRRLQIIADAFAKTQKRLSFVVCPTYSCNLRCTYCFEGELPQTNHAFMDDIDVGRVFAAIDELTHTYSDRKTSVELFGGEPLLPKTKNSVAEILKEARRRSLPVGIVTNGVHLESFAGLLSEYKETIRSMQITLDGPEDIHNLRRKTASNQGTFDKVWSSIDTLLNIPIGTLTRINVDLQNIEFIPELLSSMQKSGWTDNPYFACNLSPVRDHELKKNYEYIAPKDEMVKRVFTILKENPGSENVLQLNMFRTIKHIKSVLETNRPTLPMLSYCEANSLESIVFGPDGYLYACTESMGNKNLAIGEFRPSLKLYEEAVKMWDNRNVLTMKKCRDCDIALLCGGGCAYAALAVNGDIRKPVCDRARETIFAYLDFVKEELAKKASA